MKQIKNVIGIFLSKLMGVLIFLIILGLLNFLVPFVNETIFSQIVFFMNVNILLILLFSLFFMVAEMFFAIVFPLNLPAPLFSSFGSIFLVTFIFNILSFIDNQFDIGLEVLLNGFYILVVVIVFLSVFIGGYLSIFSKGVKRLKKVSKVVGEKMAVEDMFDKIKKMSMESLSKKDYSGGLKKVDKKKIKKKKEFKKMPFGKISYKEVGDEVRNGGGKGEEGVKGGVGGRDGGSRKKD